METLKVGVVGAGMGFERLHYPAFMELREQYKISAVCDVDQAKAVEWSKKLGLSESDAYTDFHQMVQRPDLQVIDIIVPIEQNFNVAEDVARLVSGSKKGIIVEKPLAPTLEQAKAAAALPQKYHVLMMIAENYRYEEEINLIRDLVRRGDLGEVDYFLWNRVFNFPDDMKQNTFAAREWRQHPEFPGGIFYDSAVHDMAALRHVFGGIDEVTAYGQRKAACLGQLAVVNVIIRFQSGMTGSYNFYSGGKELQSPLVGWRIWGSRGELYHEDRDSGFINLAFTDGTTRQISYKPRRGYYNELLNFHHAYFGKEKPSVTPEMELGDARTIFAVLESIEHETPVKVDEDNHYPQLGERNTALEKETHPM